MESVIEVKHLNKSFGTHEVLKDINFSVRKGDITSSYKKHTTCYR